MTSSENEDQFGPWNPGISSKIPREYLSLSTMFNPDNVSTTIQKAHELSDFSSISPFDLVAFRAERLIIHELLIRVSADLAVGDGPKYKHLGINFRKVAINTLHNYIDPHIDSLISQHDKLRRDVEEAIARELDDRLSAPLKNSKKEQDKRSIFSLFGLFKSNNTSKQTLPSATEREQQALDQWQKEASESEDFFRKSCLNALFKTVSAIISYRGRLLGDHSIAIDIAATMVCNGLGSEMIGKAIEPYILEAVRESNYKLLPAQDKPVVMNVKGASASGKSTMRNQQRILAERLDVAWDDFALISPDIWRKFLLDYDALGDAYKYAGMLCGHEIEIVDKKLDRYMAQKAANGKMSHLLIDRFRFDSFSTGGGLGKSMRLLSRFGDQIFMFFMITPPDATVERAWLRGLEFGRYKAVDDLLHHNVEAYTGMPQLLFSIADVSDKRVHYEIMDNSVPKGNLPRTIAFGWNGTMTILDIKYMLDIERYKKIDIRAETPEGVYQSADMAADQNTGFLLQCVERISVINFVDYQTGQTYARTENGYLTFRDDDYVGKMAKDCDARAGIEAIGWGATGNDLTPTDEKPEPCDLEKEQSYTLGAWS